MLIALAIFALAHVALVLGALWIVGLTRWGRCHADRLARVAGLGPGFALAILVLAVLLGRGAL